MELPPNLSYAGKTPVERELHIFFGMEAVKAEFQLYKRTRNGAHMWRCYQLWRRLMPEDLPLPRELLAYLDGCAEAVATETDPERLKRSLGLSLPPGGMAEHGGGPSSASAAEPTRKQRNAMEFVRHKMFLARTKGETPRGYKTAIYQSAAARFGYSVGHIKTLAADWSLAKVVDSDVAKWRDRGKVRRTPRD